MSKKSLFLLFVLILALSSISFSAAFALSAENASLNACTSSTVIANDIVSVDANETALTFVVSISGTAAPFTTTLPYSFSLNPSESGTIYSYITPSSKTSPGTYELVVKVEANGVVKETRHTVIVEDCRGAILKIDAEKKVCPCQATSMLLNLKNNGIYTEDYKIEVQGSLAKYVSLSQNSAVLTSNQSADITFSVNTPCDVLGSYDITFVASSNGITRATTKTSYSILSCYEYSIEIEKDVYGILEHANLTIPLTIKNYGNSNNTFKMNLYAPGWANLEKNELEVAAGGNASTNILLKPDYGISGNFTLVIDVMTVEGKIEKKKNISISIEKAYAVSLDILKSKDLICNAEPTSYDVKLKNIGKIETTLDLTIEGPEWLILNNYTVKLAPNEEKILQLNASPPYPILTQDITVKIKASDSISKTSAEDSIVIKSATKEFCFAPAIAAEKSLVNVKQDSTATLLISVENKGKEKAQYILELSGTASSFVKLNPSVISVEPRKAKTLYLYIAPLITTQLGEYDITVNARANETAILASKEVKINVLSSEAELPEEKEIKENAFVKFWKDIGAGFKNFYLKFISFFVRKPANLTLENITNITNVTENISAVNVTNISLTINESTENETELNLTESLETKAGAIKIVKQIDTINLAKNATTSIDMNEYFKDSKNKSLEFIVFSQPNLTLSFDDSKLVIKSSENSSDKYIITVFATNGEDLASMNVTVNVGAGIKGTLSLEKTWQSAKEFFIEYAYYLLGAAVLVVIIIIFSTGAWKKIIKFFEEEVPEKSKKNNNKKK